MSITPSTKKRLNAYISGFNETRNGDLSEASDVSWFIQGLLGSAVAPFPRPGWEGIAVHRDRWLLRRHLRQAVDARSAALSAPIPVPKDPAKSPSAPDPDASMPSMTAWRSSGNQLDHEHLE